MAPKPWSSARLVGVNNARDARRATDRASSRIACSSRIGIANSKIGILVSIEPFGVLTIICGLLVLVSTPALAIYLLIISTLFGAAGAVTLTSLGSANLPPSHLLLGFIVIKFLLEKKWIALALESLVFPAGLLVVVYRCLWCRVSLLDAQTVSGGDRCSRSVDPIPAPTQSCWSQFPET